MSRDDLDLFRKEALEAYRTGEDGAGDPLRIAPSWMRWTLWMLIGVVATGLAFSWFARVDEYASGRAVIWVSNVGSETTCTLIGVVEAQQAIGLTEGALGTFLPDRLPGATELVEIRRISSRLIGASEAAGLFPASATRLPASPMLKLEAPLGDCNLILGGRELDYYHGATGNFEVRLRSERIIVTLLPVLRTTTGATVD